MNSQKILKVESTRKSFSSTGTGTGPEGTLRLALVFLIAISACANNEPVSIGFAGVLTGRSADISLDARDALLLSVEDTNAKGGINGHPVKLEIADDGNETSQAIQADESLVQKNVKIIVGHILSSMTDAVQQVMHNHPNVLFFSPSMTATGLSGLDDMFIRIVPGLDVQSHLMSDEIAQDLKGEAGAGLALVYDVTNETYAKGVVDVVQKDFVKLGGKILLELPFDPRVESYGKVADAIKKSGAAAVLLSNGAHDVAMISQQIRKTDPRIRLFAPNWAYGPELLTSGGNAVDGLKVVTSYEIDKPNPEHNAFKELFEKTYGRTPSYSAYQTYDTAHILFDAMKESQSSDPKIVREKILSKGTFDGLDGKLFIDKFGDGVRQMSVEVIKNGSFVLERVR